jgi:hypothetical protein
MKLQSPSRRSSRRPSLRPTGSLLSSAVRGSRATVRESWYSDREPRFTDHVSLLANPYSPNIHFLIDSSAIRNARNSSAINTKPISNRSKIACRRARFSHVLRSKNHQSRATGRGSLPTNHESRITSHGIIVLSNAQRTSLNESAAALPGHRQSARQETGFCLRSSNTAALILGTKKDNA